MSDGFKIRDMLILDDDRIKTIKLNGESFKVKALFPKDYKAIARKLAMDYNGLPATSYSLDDRYMFERDATIDQAVEESPNWWTNAEDCPDIDTLQSIYTEIENWNKAFQEKLKKNKFAKRGPRG